jgi:hypothetical protein
VALGQQQSVDSFLGLLFWLPYQAGCSLFPAPLSYMDSAQVNGEITLVFLSSFYLIFIIVLFFGLK